MAIPSYRGCVPMSPTRVRSPARTMVMAAAEAVSPNRSSVGTPSACANFIATAIDGTETPRSTLDK